MRAFVVILLCLSNAAFAVDSSDWAQGRAAQRASREKLRNDEAKDRLARADKAAAIISAVIDEAIKLKFAGSGQADDIKQLLKGLKNLDPAKVDPLEMRLRELEFAKLSAAAGAERAWKRVYAQKRDQIIKPMEAFFKVAVDAGVVDIAHDFVQRVLAFHPDHPVLHKNIGQAKHGDKWYGPRGTELVKAGLIWDDALGWIVESKADRYKSGEYFDLLRKSWTRVPEADAYHRNPDKPWVVQTEHLEIRGTATLKDLVDAANRLEQFYEQIFAAYAGVFFKGSQNDLKLIFGMLNHPRLQVNIAKDEEDYRRSLPSGVDAGWSDGMFVPSTEASYFYAGSSEVLYHEFTHQVLHVFSGMDAAPAWLVEGVAVYTQSPGFVDGRMRLGALSANKMVMAYLLAKNAMKLDELLAIESGAVWAAAKEPALQYSAAGALVQFCMEADGRKYRDDFVDFLRDSYLGQAGGHRLWEYLGITRYKLDEEFDAWVKAESLRLRK